MKNEKRKQKMSELIIGCLLFYIILVGSMYLRQRSMMYFPETMRMTPVQAGVGDMSAIQVRTDDGLTIQGWYKAPTSPDKPVLVFFHGNGGSINGRGYVARPYLDAGYGFLFGEYRGYGGNPGSPTEQGLYNDARAYTEWLLKEQNVPPGKIAFFGESLGTGVAVKMASEYKSAGALVLLSPYTSFPDIAAPRYWFAPVRLMMKDRYDSLGLIGNVHMPLLVLHGKRDDVVSFELGKTLFDKANEPKRMDVFPEAGHNDMYRYDVQTHIIDFLKNQKVAP